MPFGGYRSAGGTGRYVANRKQ